MIEQQGVQRNKKVQWLVQGVFCVILLCLQPLISVGLGDDPVFAEYFQDNALLPFLWERYMTWTSRIILEAVVMPLSAWHPLVWRVLNIAMVLLLIWIITDLFHIGEEDSKIRTQLLFFVLIWTIPIVSLYSSGWMTTTTHYVWTLTLGLVAMRPIKHELLSEKCPVWEYMLCPLCVIYAGNMEQMGAILFGIYLVFGLYLLTEKKKLSPFYCCMLALIILSLCFVLGAPGNVMRKAMEVERFFPTYTDFSVYERLAMGFIESANYYIAGGHLRCCYLFPLLTGVLLGTFVQKLCKEKADRRIDCWLQLLIAACPFVFYWGVAQLGIFLFDRNMLRRGLDYIALFVLNRQIPGEGHYSWGMVSIQIAGYLLVLACVALTIYFLHGKSKETLLELVILLAGFVSRVIIGFSPTIYASGDRTALFCSMAMIIVTLRNLQLFWNRAGYSWEKLLIMSYVVVNVLANLF